MTDFVLDCSVSMTWWFVDEVDDYADRVLDALDDAAALVPSIWPLEVANALLVAERRSRFTPADTWRTLDNLRALPIIIDEERSVTTIANVVSLAREYKLSAYDGAYLELATRLGLPLASRDRALIEAGERCGVSLLRP